MENQLLVDKIVHTPGYPKANKKAKVEASLAPLGWAALVCGLA
jgi:hypothetical protein